MDLLRSTAKFSFFLFMYSTVLYNKWQMNILAWRTTGVILRGQAEIFNIKSCSTASLPTTNLTWTNMKLNPVLHSERSVTNYLSYGVVCQVFVISTAVLSKWIKITGILDVVTCSWLLSTKLHDTTSQETVIFTVNHNKNFKHCKVN